ncbi:MAG: hypothetical protein JSS16_01620 [Proteobacteria bacterium]|uniref:hypothetical protein n=1 Tax=Rudaea sp. TaxID=2136325 RepID=UPI001D239DE0|nr:hypothetical protein [Pseudomonadota bacterium]MBS0568203.1 hypothetical protein [Pseudomonadota bacterium]
MSHSSPKQLSWWPLALTAVAGIAFCAACYYPGAMSLDSAVIWSQARGAPSTNIYGAGLRWLWWLTDKLWTGPGPLFLIQLALLWSGLVLVARALDCGLVARIAFVLAAALAPVVFVLIAHVWTDVMLLATLAFAVGALLRWRDARGAGWLGASWLALAFAMTLRHNVLPAALPLAAWCVWLHPRAIAIAPARRHGVIFGAVLVLGLGLQAIGMLSAQAAQRRYTLWPATTMWDLAAISLDANRMLLPPATHKPELSLDDLRGAFQPYSNVSIFTATRGRVMGPFFLPGEAAVTELREASLAAITGYPAAYVAQRWRLIRALFGSKPRDWPHELVYVDDELQFRDNPPVAPNRSALHAICIHFAEALRDTSALASWPYLALSLFALVFAWRHRARANAQAALAVLASGLAYAAPLPLIAPSAELRYLGWTCLAAVVGAALALTSGLQTRTEATTSN